MTEEKEEKNENSSIEAMRDLRDKLESTHSRWLDDRGLIHTTEKGKCPDCGSVDLVYYGRELTKRFLGFRFACTMCGCQGTEWYTLEYFDTTTVNREKEE